MPLYLLVYKLHLYDTLFALMLTMSAAAVPLSVLVMVSFVRDISPGSNLARRLRIEAAYSL